MIYFSIQFKSPVHPIRTKLNNRSKIYLNTIPGNNLKFTDFKGGYQYENMPDISEIFVKRVLSLIYEGISVSKSQKSFSKTESFIKTYVHFFTNRFDYILSSPWLKITIIKDKDLTSRKFARLVKSPNCTNQKYILKWVWSCWKFDGLSYQEAVLKIDEIIQTEPIKERSRGIHNVPVRLVLVLSLD